MEDRPESGSNSGESGVFSGISQPVATEQLLERLQSALGVASKGESSLGSMQNALHESTRELEASRQAHQSLAEELRVLYRGLNELLSEKAGLERYAALLTQERDAALDAAGDARREAQQDRQFLIEEQDRFIRLLMEEHEAELAGAQATTPQGATVEEVGEASSEKAISEAVLASILPPPVEIGEASQVGQGDWDPQDWAVSSQVVQDEEAVVHSRREPFELLSASAARESIARSASDSEEEHVVDKEPTQPIAEESAAKSAPVARVMLKRVTATELEAVREQAANRKVERSEVNATSTKYSHVSGRSGESAANDSRVALDSLGEEVQERNSDRPPPVEFESRQATAKMPATGPSQWIDTLVSNRHDVPGAGTDSDSEADPKR